MKNIFLIFFLFAISSCAMSLAPQGNGLFYTESKEVLYYDPYIQPQQVLTLCAKNYLGLVSVGDNSFDAVRMNSSIRKISTMERTYSSRFILYGESCLIVKGE